MGCMRLNVKINQINRTKEWFELKLPWCLGFEQRTMTKLRFKFNYLVRSTCPRGHLNTGTGASGMTEVWWDKLDLLLDGYVNNTFEVFRNSFLASKCC